MWNRLKNCLRRRQVDAEFFVELEATLLAADVGPTLTTQWMTAVRKWKRMEDVQRVLRGGMHAALDPACHPEGAERPKDLAHDSKILRFAQSDTNPSQDDTRIIMIVGVNGVGKTTTIAKLAHYAKQRGRKPLLVAADTFRAAAIEQLKVWGDRLEVPVIAQQIGSDAAAVAFDGIQAAQARACDTVLVDTAGRLHTKAPLMDELAKVKRVMGKAMVGAPHECWCVIDGMTGQNALRQVRHFHEVLALTGVILTKMDGVAKAGTVFTIKQELRLPICFVGTGERVEDLQPFHAQTFVEQLMVPS